MKDIKLFANGLFFCLCFIAPVLNSHGQQGYSIRMNIEGLGTEPVLLGHFFGESTYVVDTSRVNGTVHSFSGADPLPEGMYFVAHNKQRLFDFIIASDQEFEISSDMADVIGQMTVSGDPNNSLFVEDMKYNKARNQEAAPFLAVLQDSTSLPADRERAQAGLSELNTRVQAYRDALITSHPNSFLALFYRAQRSKMPGETADRAQIEALKSQYWADFDLADPRLLRLNTPLYKEKVNDYLDHWVYQDPDSLSREIDTLASVASADADTYKYLIWMLTLKYQNPRIMGQDALFVHMYDTYFATGEMNYWANEQLRNNVKEFADQLRNSLIGKKAPNMIMLDADLRPKSLYDIPNRFTVIYFFDPDCHHCKLATPVLDSLYDSGKYDLEVFAVSTDTSMVKMKAYIQDMNLTWQTVNGPRTSTEPYYKLYDAMTTPTIYILNEKKEIIAKKLPVERIDHFLSNYQARKEDEAH